MITSFISHYLGGQARNMFWGHLSEMLLYRASEATTFVNTCRLLFTNPGPGQITSGLPTIRWADHSGGHAGAQWDVSIA